MVKILHAVLKNHADISGTNSFKELLKICTSFIIPTTRCIVRGYLKYGSPTLSHTSTKNLNMALRLVIINVGSNSVCFSSNKKLHTNSPVSNVRHDHWIKALKSHLHRVSLDLKNIFTNTGEKVPQIWKWNNTQSCKQVILSLESVNILLKVEANPVQMRFHCYSSVVMSNTKLDNWKNQTLWNYFLFYSTV